MQLLRYASFLSKSLTIDSVGLRKAVKKVSDEEVETEEYQMVEEEE